MKAFISGVVALCAIAACTARQGYVIEGTSPELADGEYVYVLDFSDWKVLDSALVRNSSVRIEGEDMGCGAAMLYMGESSAPDALTQISGILFLEDGTISFFDSSPASGLFLFKGSPMNDAYTGAVLSAGEGEDMKERGMELIKTNHNALGCVLLLNSMSAFSKPEIERMLEEYPSSMKRNPLTLRLRDMLDLIKADLGMPYWDFSCPDASGRQLSLGDVVEREGVRYVLLDFWASWCGPCRAEFPNLRAAYEEYHDSGFEIFGVSFDSDREAWLSTIDSAGLLWPNVMAEDGVTRDSAIWQAYGLNGIPWNYLIDAESGIIVAKNLRGKELGEKLEELL